MQQGQKNRRDVFWYSPTIIGTRCFACDIRNPAMTPSRQVGRCLDDEHRSHLESLNRVEQALGRGTGADIAALAASLLRHLEHEIGRHFEFEETRLFPLMAEAGDGDLAMLLTEEHDNIRAVADELAPLARSAAAAAPAPAAAAALRRLMLELVERQVAHIQKESMALLPLLDDLLDDETDRQLAFAYAAG
jgi:hemerythrin-like domain-containing protein